MKYHFVSVPLVTSNNSLSNLFLRSYLFDFNESINDWNALGSSTTAVLDETRGYMIYFIRPDTTYKFSGELNNGTFTATTSYTPGKGYNLVSNPYPSAIDWNLVERTNIDAATYIWVPETSNYAAYVSDINTNDGSNIIPVGQSFFVKANAANPVLVMKNTARVHNSKPFLKETASNILRIKADNSDEIVIRFKDGATANFDSEFDAYKLQGGKDAPQISSTDNYGNKLSINTLPFGDVVVPLSIESAETLTVSGIESFYESISIYLEDLTTGALIDLRVTPVISHATHQYQLRFKGVTGISEITTGNVVVRQGVLYVDAPNPVIMVYDMSGRLLSSCKNPQTIAPSVPGVYMVKVLTGNTSFTRKVVIN